MTPACGLFAVLTKTATQLESQGCSLHCQRQRLLDVNWKVIATRGVNALQMVSLLPRVGSIQMVPSP